MYGQYNQGRGRGRGYRGGYRGGYNRGGRGHGGRGGRGNTNFDDPLCIMPLKATLKNDQINKIKVELHHSNTNICKAQIISFDSTVPYNKELLLRTVQDYSHKIGENNLHCNNGDRLFTTIRQIIGPTQTPK